jgi:hypothetical protein
MRRMNGRVDGAHEDIREVAMEFRRTHLPRP